MIAELEGWIKEAEHFIKQKTRLALYVEDNKEYDYIE